MPTAVARRRSVNVWTVGIVAGIIGGILLDLFLVIATKMSIVSIYQFIASNAVGSAAFASPSYAWLGATMHFAISIAWGVLFIVLAQRWQAFFAGPYAWGPIYGLFVMVCMTLLLMAKHGFAGAPPSPTMLLNSFIAHVVFFGLPVALYASRQARRVL